MTIAQWLQRATTTLKQAGILSARLDAEVLACHIMQKDRGWLIAHDNETITKTTLTTLERALMTRQKRAPLAYITHHKEFYGLDFYVDERVLCPRAETESALTQIIKHAPKNGSLIDVGTGSGAIAIAIAKHRPDLTITAAELSPDALEVAHKNANKLLQKHQISFIKSDIFANVTEQFDVVVANLPYVSKSFELLPEVASEPDVALFGGEADGLSLYRRFFKTLPDHLRPKAQVYIESDPWQQAELIDLAGAIGLNKIYEDYFILGFEA